MKSLVLFFSLLAFIGHQHLIPKATGSITAAIMTVAGYFVEGSKKVKNGRPDNYILSD